jgi:glycosyltransferase involved in cell wall biosynthesis
MAAGLPVLSSNCISVKRILDETHAGETYIFDSPADFANTVKRLFRERENSYLYGLNGQKAVRDTYNWQQSSSSLLNIYSSYK